MVIRASISEHISPMQSAKCGWCGARPNTQSRSAGRSRGGQDHESLGEEGECHRKSPRIGTRSGSVRSFRPSLIVGSVNFLAQQGTMVGYVSCIGRVGAFAVTLWVGVGVSY